MGWMGGRALCIPDPAQFERCNQRITCYRLPSAGPRHYKVPSIHLDGTSWRFCQQASWGRRTGR